MSAGSSDRKPGPYELGLSGSADAIPVLIEFLGHGRANERRLAASAIRKLATAHRSECQAALPALVACLDESGPQVRQYALKALSVLRLSPEALERIRLVREGDDRSYNRALAATILRRDQSARGSNDVGPPDGAGAGRPDPLRLGIERCLKGIDILEADLNENLETLWEAEDELAEARLGLAHAEQALIVRGVEGKNEAERRAHMAALLRRERAAVEDAERALRFARREQDEYRAAQELIRQRMKALELLVSLRMLDGG